MAMLLYAGLQFTSPYTMSAFVALTKKQFPFEVRTLDLAIGANNDPEYMRRHRSPSACPSAQTPISMVGLWAFRAAWARVVRPPLLNRAAAVAEFPCCSGEINH
jgi:hypothetical protein